MQQCTNEQLVVHHVRSGEYVPDSTECIIAIMNELGKQAKALLIQLCVAYVRPTSHFVIKNPNAISRHVHRQHMRACMRTYIYLNYLYSFAILGYGSRGMVDHAVPEGRVDARRNKSRTPFLYGLACSLVTHICTNLSRHASSFAQPRNIRSVCSGFIGSKIHWFLGSMVRLLLGSVRRT